MPCYQPVLIYVDSVLTFTDSIIRVTMVLTYSFDGNSEIVIYVGPHPLQPGNPYPTAFVELCGGSTINNPGGVNDFPLDDFDDYIDEFCDIVTGSYDPNDKMGYPPGKRQTITSMQINVFNIALGFRMRNDTAFTVVVRDTLDTDLNIASVTSGVASHDYDLDYGPRVLEWTFNNILLRDSFTNEPESRLCDIHC